MSTKLIQTKDYLLLIDEEAEICQMDLYLDVDCDTVTRATLTSDQYSGCKKVIAYYPLIKEAKELDLPWLPNPFKEVDFDNTSELKILLEKRAEKSNTCDLNEYALGLLAGYKVAQSKGQYSLEDIKKAIEMARDYYDGFTYTEKEIIQSLSTQKLPSEFISEYENKCWCLKPMSGGCFECTKVLKTITNSEGKKEIQGTYKY